MQSRILSWMIVLVGVVMIGSTFVQGQSPATYAAPLRAVTPTAEPPTPTATPPATNTPVPTNTPAPPSSPTVTPILPTNTAAPSNTPAPTRAPDPGRPDITVVKTASQQSARSGDSVSFTLIVTNLGDAAADDVTVSDTLPDGFDFVQATTSRGTTSINGRTFTANIGTVQPGETITIIITTTVNASAQPGQTRNVALVNTITPGDNPNNNTSSVTIDLVPLPAAATPSTAPVPTTVITKPRTLPATGERQDWGAFFVLCGTCLIIGGLVAGFWRPRNQRN